MSEGTVTFDLSQPKSILSILVPEWVVVPTFGPKIPSRHFWDIAFTGMGRTTSLLSWPSTFDHQNGISSSLNLNFLKALLRYCVNKNGIGRQPKKYNAPPGHGYFLRSGNPPVPPQKSRCMSLVSKWEQFDAVPRSGDLKLWFSSYGWFEI